MPNALRAYGAARVGLRRSEKAYGPLQQLAPLGPGRRPGCVMSRKVEGNRPGAQWPWAQCKNVGRQRCRDLGGGIRLSKTAEWGVGCRNGDSRDLSYIFPMHSSLTRAPPCTHGQFYCFVPCGIAGFLEGAGLSTIEKESAPPSRDSRNGPPLNRRMSRRRCHVLRSQVSSWRCSKLFIPSEHKNGACPAG